MVKAANKGVKFIDDGPLNTINRKSVHEFRNIHKHLVDKPVTRVNISQLYSVNNIIFLLCFCFAAHSQKTEHFRLQPSRTTLEENQTFR